MHVYIYIYIYRERERECVCVYIYVITCFLKPVYLRMNAVRYPKRAVATIRWYAPGRLLASHLQKARELAHILWTCSTLKGDTYQRPYNLQV